MGQKNGIYSDARVLYHGHPQMHRTGLLAVVARRRLTLETCHQTVNAATAQEFHGGKLAQNETRNPTLHRALNGTLWGGSGIAQCKGTLEPLAAGPRLEQSACSRLCFARTFPLQLEPRRARAAREEIL